MTMRQALGYSGHEAVWHSDQAFSCPSPRKPYVNAVQRTAVGQAFGRVGGLVPGRSDDAATGVVTPGDGQESGPLSSLAGQGRGSSLIALDEPELVDRAKVDSQAFALLYERHVRSVFAFALSKVRDVGMAEDVTSQTFLKALRAMPRYENRGVPFRSWLLRIASNTVVDIRRTPHTEVALRRKPDCDEPDEEVQVVDERAEQDIAAWEQAEAFSRLIADLTAEQRTAVQLRFVDGLQIAGIAKQMSRSEGSVKMLLMRALQNLRRTLEQETHDAG